MLLRCNPDAADVITKYGHTLMQCLYVRKWKFFGDQKEQVMNDLKQHPSYWKSKEQQALLRCALEELIGGVPCAGQWQGLSLVGSWITMIWSRSLPNIYETDNILELSY
jgi:hypothetical protein